MSADLRGMAAGELTRVLQAIEAELPRLHRAQDAEGLLRSLRCHIEARLGASIEEQIGRYGIHEGDLAGPHDPKRSRDRVYQYRARGRAAGCEALASLVAQGRFAYDDVTDAQRLLGCDLIVPGGKVDLS